MTKKMMARERRMRARMRRDPGGRLALAVGDYLKTLGWSVLMTGPFSIEKYPGSKKFDHRFVVEFWGSKQQRASPRKADAVDPSAGIQERRPRA